VQDIVDVRAPRHGLEAGGTALLDSAAVEDVRESKGCVVSGEAAGDGGSDGTESEHGDAATAGRKRIGGHFGLSLISPRPAIRSGAGIGT